MVFPRHPQHVDAIDVFAMSSPVRERETMTPQVGASDIHVRSERVLDPLDRNAEVLFGLFMVVSFTGTLSVATAGRNDVSTMLIAAIGCNTAWGLVDALMYVLRNLVTRGREAAIEHAIRAADRLEDAHRLIGDAMGPMAQALDPPSLERVRQFAIGRSMRPASGPAVTPTDLKGALAIFLLVFASTFPVVLPFIFVGDLQLAKRLSAAIAIAMMFRCGQQWGRYAGLSPWRAGLVVAVLGCVIEGIVIALGG